MHRNQRKALAVDVQPPFRIHGAADTGKVYGQSPVAVSPGFVYNKRIWKEAGITEWPTTPAEFVADLKAIKTKTDAIPYYTNFSAGWPLSSWTSVDGAVTCDPKAT